GLAYLLVGDPKDAISCFGSALAIDPNEVSALIYLAQAQLRQGDFEESNKNLDRALHIAADHPRALLVKGKYFKATGKPEVALTWLKRSIQHNPQFLPAMMELGNVYFSLT
ncbi:MAG: tetratricopeptide repeat protein, partial [Candidatus Thorarchaeota archaeon]